MNHKIAIGLSGGVDSAVAAYLLKKEGWEVVGFTMETGGPSVAKEAQKVAQQLEIPLHIVDVKKAFHDEVMSDFITAYISGKTPNPCVECNPRMKWGALMKEADKFGITEFATGHYANIIRLENNRYTVKMCDSLDKDQTYVLYQLSQEQLAHTRMPLGHYDKGEIRKMAEEIGLSVANKPDSMEICFIPDNDYCHFIETECHKCHKEIPPEGNFVDQNGTVLGKHKGIHHYTIGQRKGLGIALGYPAFVLRIIPETNTVVLGSNDDLMSKKVYAREINWVGMAPIKIGEEIPVTARIRYNHRGANAVLRCLEKDLIECEFETPQRAATPGQSLVVYQNGGVAVGGKIVIL